MKRNRRLSKLKLELWESGRPAIEIAHKVGISESLLSRYVNGWKEPDEPTKIKIADALGKKLSDLF